MIGRFLKTCVQKTVRLSCGNLERGPHIIRYYMYQHLRKVLAAQNLKPKKILSISHSERLVLLFDTTGAEIIATTFPEYDLAALPFEDGEFDVVVSDYVLEHIAGDPQEAIDESFRVLKEGGLAVHSTCFINPIHYGPKDFWRFTPDALRWLCRNFSEIIDAGGWGNRALWVLVVLGMRYEPIPNAPWHWLNKLAMHNEEEWPTTTWVVARK